LEISGIISCLDGTVMSVAWSSSSHAHLQTFQNAPVYKNYRYSLAHSQIFVLRNSYYLYYWTVSKFFYWQTRQSVSKAAVSKEPTTH